MILLTPSLSSLRTVLSAAFFSSSNFRILPGLEFVAVSGVISPNIPILRPATSFITYGFMILLRLASPEVSIFEAITGKPIYSEENPAHGQIHDFRAQRHQRPAYPTFHIQAGHCIS